ncbi:nitroreductase family protein, partial [Acidimicrobium ferrooxidans]|nr:nitroreductase family protein [Acidimicrobium ferrooxidans]
MLSYDQFLELVKSRRSVRTFTDERVSEAVLQKIFQAGNLAPTSCNQQAYRFVVVNDPELIGAFAKISSPKVLRSPQFMLCLTH